jgi:hypothetical protein
MTMSSFVSRATWLPDPEEASGALQLFSALRLSRGRRQPSVVGDPIGRALGIFLGQLLVDLARALVGGFGGTAALCLGAGSVIIVLLG